MMDMDTVQRTKRTYSMSGVCLPTLSALRDVQGFLSVCTA